MKVHLVEDENSIAQAIGQYLKNNTDFEVITSKNGNDAVDEIVNSSPDVIILDIFLPGQDGLSVLEGIRGKSVAAPVVIFSNMGAGVVDIKKLADLGVKKLYLKAETSLEKLVETINEITG